MGCCFLSTELAELRNYFLEKKYLYWKDSPEILLQNEDLRMLNKKFC